MQPSPPPSSFLPHNPQLPSNNRTRSGSEESLQEGLASGFGSLGLLGTLLRLDALLLDCIWYDG